MPNTFEEKDWDLLLRRIKDGRCTPFLGAGACFGVLPLGAEIAKEWAQKYNYPLDDSTNLIRVAQFLAVNRDSMFPKEEILKKFKAFKAVPPNVSPPDFMAADEPHGILADLPLPVYMTTNYDSFMVQALRSRKKDPKREFCRWNRELKSDLSVFDKGSNFEPTSANPVVFHLHGHDEKPQSLVLTEDDYLEFLMNFSKDEDLLPPRIQRALTDSSLLFIGYAIADWNFRVLFRSLVSYMAKSLSRSHVSVQIVPGGDQASQQQKENAQTYLTDYYRELKIRVYWGTAKAFVTELKQRWEAFNRA